MKGGSLGNVFARPSTSQQQGACNCGSSQPAPQPTPYSPPRPSWTPSPYNPNPPTMTDIGGWGPASRTPAAGWGMTAQPPAPPMPPSGGLTSGMIRMMQGDGGSPFFAPRTYNNYGSGGMGGVLKGLFG